MSPLHLPRGDNGCQETLHAMGLAARGGIFPHTNTDLATVMAMLDDARPESGCVQVARSSRRLGVLDHDRWADRVLLMRGRRRERVRSEPLALRLPKVRHLADHPFGHAWNQDGAMAAARDEFAASVLPLP